MTKLCCFGRYFFEKNLLVFSWDSGVIATSLDLLLLHFLLLCLYLNQILHRLVWLKMKSEYLCWHKNIDTWMFLNSINWSSGLMNKSQPITYPLQSWLCLALLPTKGLQGASLENIYVDGFKIKFRNRLMHFQTY